MLSNSINLCSTSSNWAIIPRKLRKIKLFWERLRHSWSQYSNQMIKKIRSMIRHCQVGLNAVDSEVMLQTRAVNPVMSTQRVSGEISISQSSMVRKLYDLGNSIRSCWSALDVTKILQNFWLNLVLYWCKISPNYRKATALWGIIQKIANISPVILPIISVPYCRYKDSKSLSSDTL